MNIEEKMNRFIGEKIVLGLMLDKEGEAIGILKGVGWNYLIIEEVVDEKSRGEILFNLECIFPISLYDEGKLSAI